MANNADFSSKEAKEIFQRPMEGFQLSQFEDDALQGLNAIENREYKEYDAQFASAAVQLIPVDSLQIAWGHFLAMIRELETIIRNSRVLPPSSLKKDAQDLHKILTYDPQTPPLLPIPYGGPGVSERGLYFALRIYGFSGVETSYDVRPLVSLVTRYINSNWQHLRATGHAQSTKATFKTELARDEEKRLIVLRYARLQRLAEMGYVVRLGFQKRLLFGKVN